MLFTKHGFRRGAAQASANSEVFTKHETRDTKHGFFSTRSSKQGLLVLKPFSLFFSPGDRFMLKVMTPLWGTKTPSALVGAKSGGDRKSRPVAAFLRGMGRLWRGMGGMGGMGRPEPLSANRPHQQQGLSVFHETRDTNHGFYASLPRPFPAISHHFPVKNLPLSQYPRPVRPSRLASRRTPSAEAPVALRAASAAAKVQSAMLRKGNTSSEVFTKHGETCFSRVTAFTAVRFSVGARGVASQETAVRTTAPTAKSLFYSSPLFTIVHYCSPLFAIVRQKNIVLRQCPLSVRTGNTACLVFTKHEPRATAFVVARHGAAMGRHGRHGAPRTAVRVPPAPVTEPFGFSRNTSHEPRNTAFFSHAVAVGW